WLQDTLAARAVRDDMTNRWVLVSLAAGAGAVAPVVLSAQQSPRFPDPRVYNDELSPGQIQRAQEPDSARRSTSTSRAQQPTQTGRAIACGGVFAKDSNHLKLATVYKPDNVAFTEVEAPEGKKLMASVLFAKDPKRRLEVWWQNEAARSDIYLIVIN